MATTANFGFSTPDNTAYVKDGALAMRTLGNNIDARFGDVTNFPSQIVNVVSGVSKPLPFAMESGSGNYTSLVGGSTSATATITFIVGRFSQAPNVTITNTNPFNTVFWPAVIRSVSNTSAAIAAGGSASPGSSAYSFYYNAVQMKSATAAG
jgi:hypothetical protein